jgi:uncharacterized membrane protein YkvA (DUF1232 family)
MIFRQRSSLSSLPSFKANIDMRASLFQRLRVLAELFKRELQVYRLTLKDPRTPMLAKLLLGLAIGYTLLPFDFIPDFIPIIGHLDDVIIVPTLIILALKLIPTEVVTECRSRVIPADR